MSTHIENGTEFGDIMFVNAAEIPVVDTVTVNGRGGDDVIIRDRTGGYKVDGASYTNMTIYGGTATVDFGTDIVSYVGASDRLVANLERAFAKVDQVLAKDYGYDHLFGVEGLVGTVYGDDLTGDSKDNFFYGHDGSDELWGRDGDDTLYGGQGNDTVYGEADDDEIYGEGGADSLYGGTGVDLIHGGNENDTIYGGGQDDTIYGGSHHDTIYGGDGKDLVFAGGGSDTIYGGNGNDRIHVEAGNDRAYGGADNDRVYVAGTGDNKLYGGSGLDWLHYELATDVVVNLLGETATHAGGLDEVFFFENVRTGTGDDVVVGGVGSNHIETGGGADVVYTVGGEDTVVAGGGSDTVVGYDGDERLYGQSGNDFLYGGDGEDRLYGGTNVDRIDGGDGDDVLWGGSEADVFYWGSDDEGLDIVKDFDVNADELSFEAGYFFGQDEAWFDVEDALFAAQAFGETRLLAHRDDGGWDYIAVFEGVGVAALNQRIANGSIFDVNPDGSEGFGDLAGAGISVAPTGWDMVA